VKLARDEMHVLTGGYALDALAPQETDAFERHLQHCGPCEAEVRGLRETAARLALAKARRPPARLQQRVLPAPPDGRVYQVWVIGPAGTRSAGFLSGTGLALTGVRAGERVGVTVEPAGGTSQPTTTPIVLVPVPV